MTKSKSFVCTRIAGVICIAQINQDEWVRAEVVAVEDEKAEVTARLVDIGGYVDVPIESLRQIRVDFVTIPFQATECRLANLTPINEEEGWSEDALNFFKILCQGQVLQANVVGYSLKDNITLVHLYKLNENHVS
jgi:A-kinase anchor protein 1